MTIVPSIAAKLGVACGTVRRYARVERAPQGPKAATHRLRASKAVAEPARALFKKEAAGNAVVVQGLRALGAWRRRSMCYLPPCTRRTVARSGGNGALRDGARQADAARL